MKNNQSSNQFERLVSQPSMYGFENTTYPRTTSKRSKYFAKHQSPVVSEILVISSYPPRECGIATYSQDLIKALNAKFSNSLSIKVCALENGDASYEYPPEVKYKLNTTHVSSYVKLAEKINEDDRIQLVVLQHEFGFFRDRDDAFLELLYDLEKPIVLVFHTVLPNPDKELRLKVKNIVSACRSAVVMTHTSSDILMKDYGISKQKITVIPHGTHLVTHQNKKTLKTKYELTGRKVLSTFGLLSSGKNIETTLDALPAIIEKTPEVMFLVLGRTHPVVVKNDGEVYRESLERKVKELGIESNVRFVNKYLSLNELLEYLQLTDVYVFTSKDPNQAVSGTFVYAMSCGCPIISTPIPHAKELLSDDTGIIFDFGNSKQLADSVTQLLTDEELRGKKSINTMHKIVSTAWENSAVAHAMLFQEITENKIQIQYNLPPINLDHLKAMTTDFAMIQFSVINQPDISSGYTLDDNARALIASSMCYKFTGEKATIEAIRKYLNFIKFCQQPKGDFLNYVDKNKNFTEQNKEVNLDDSNGRALWALGYVVSLRDILPKDIVADAIAIFESAIPSMRSVSSPRSMSFIIKGIYYYQDTMDSNNHRDLVKVYALRLLQMYKRESTLSWEWFESSLTYANSVIPEAMLYAYLMTGEAIYKDIARTSFNFLLSYIFNENGIEVISNKTWLHKGQEPAQFGEQPIDVAYTIMTLSHFYDVIEDEDYHNKMVIAFNWFLGKNRLQQIIYNPCTGGCYDGLEETHVNLNQGAESTVSYLMARLTMEKYK